MRRRRVRRAPDVDGEGRLVGIVSIADLARSWAQIVRIVAT